MVVAACFFVIMGCVALSMMIDAVSYAAMMRMLVLVFVLLFSKQRALVCFARRLNRNRILDLSFSPLSIVSYYNTL